MNTTRTRQGLAGLTALALGTLAPASLAIATESTPLDFNQTAQLPITAAGFSKTGSCPDQPEGQDGWHFVAPSGTFASLRAVFDIDGDPASTDDQIQRTLDDAIQHPGPAHAYVYAPAGSMLIEASATGTAANSAFVLSHTCAVDPDEPGTGGGGTEPGEPGGGTAPQEPDQGLLPAPEETAPTPTPTPTPEPEVDEEQAEGDGVDTEESTDETTEESTDETTEEAAEELAHTGGSLAAAILGGTLLAGGAGLSLVARRNTSA